jgi:hypothetical protein
MFSVLVFMNVEQALVVEMRSSMTSHVTGTWVATEIGDPSITRSLFTHLYMILPVLLS